MVSGTSPTSTNGSGNSDHSSGEDRRDRGREVTVCLVPEVCCRAGGTTGLPFKTEGKRRDGLDSGEGLRSHEAS